MFFAIAKPSDYISYRGQYRLNMPRCLLLRGAITDDPVVGAEQYNAALVKRLKVVSEGRSQRLKERRQVNRIYQRFADNRRVRSIFGHTQKGAPIDTLSPTEQFLLFKFTAFLDTY